MYRGSNQNKNFVFNFSLHSYRVYLWFFRVYGKRKADIVYTQRNFDLHEAGLFVCMVFFLHIFYVIFFWIQKLIFSAGRTMFDLSYCHDEIIVQQLLHVARLDYLARHNVYKTFPN